MNLLCVVLSMNGSTKRMSTGGRNNSIVGALLFIKLLYQLPLPLCQLHWDSDVEVNILIPEHRGIPCLYSFAPQDNLLSWLGTLPNLN
uniref:Uncharacterized protein n=1 Tax=Arundo donax TaxID=35708 RepID=A0A0A9DCM6_ARUDO